jgi:beta-mannosidase
MRETDIYRRHIYEILLPDVVERLSSISYRRSSPYGGKSSGDLTVGDAHQWNVWHGTQEPWNNWDKLAGRFISYVVCEVSCTSMLTS